MVLDIIDLKKEKTDLVADLLQIAKTWISCKSQLFDLLEK